MTDSQIQGIESLAGAQLQQIRDQFRRIADLPREERRKAIAGWQETRVKLTNEARQKINDLLSKSQRSRFAELEFRFHLQRGRIREALASAGVELDEESRDKLDNAEQLVRADVQQRIAQIQQETNTAILAAIMDTATIERLMGDQYIFRADEPLQRGGPGRFLGGSARIDRETDDDSPDPDETDDEQSNRRRRRDRSTREEN